MKQLRSLVARAKNHKHVVYGCIGVVAVLAVTIMCNYFYVGSYSSRVITPESIASKHIPVGIVFGAGISTDNKPYKELQARLDVAADALKNGSIQKLILSGDNRFENYNEPDVMVAYLADERGIEKEKLQPDYAGRSSYETCERAAKIFGVKRAILFSAGSHLPRAVFLCKHFGIDAYGVSSGLEANNAFRREFLARNKAVFNAYLLGEQTVLGEKIDLHIAW
jgi:vancomycin permeability regulator SanA